MTVFIIQYYSIFYRFFLRLRIACMTPDDGLTVKQYFTERIFTRDPRFSVGWLKQIHLRISNVDWANACRFSRPTNLSPSVYYIVFRHPVSVWHVFRLKRTGQALANSSPKHSANGQISKKLHRFSNWSLFFIVTVAVRGPLAQRFYEVKCSPNLQI